ncbi:MAG: hypothetical protein WBX02_07455 [Terriglobales bacterium]
MLRESLRRLIGLLKRTPGIEAEQLLQLSEAILEHGRMIRAYHEYFSGNIMVEITELASRFRETPHAIEDALLLLRKKGLAEPAGLPGCWKLRLGDSGRSDKGDAA